MAANSAASGETISVKPRSASSAGVSSGVLPVSTMLATSVMSGSAAAIASSSAIDLGRLDEERVDAGVARHRRPLDGVVEADGGAGVGPRRDVQIGRGGRSAARSLASHSSVGTTCLPAMWPHRFGHTWSSRNMPAAPAGSHSSTVRMVLSGLP